MRRAAWAAVAVPVLAACMPQESDQERRRAYAWNVEGCLCRALEYEVDYEGRSPWPRLVERCNETVRAANVVRYPADAHFAPAINTLRCDREVAEWLAAAPRGQGSRQGES